MYNIISPELNFQCMQHPHKTGELGKKPQYLLLWFWPYA